MITNRQAGLEDNAAHPGLELRADHPTRSRDDVYAAPAEPIVGNISLACRPNLW